MVSIIRWCCAAAVLALAPATLLAGQEKVRFTASDAQAWRLEVVDRQDNSVFDSGWTFGATLEWPLVDAQGLPVADGSYRYTLTIRTARDTLVQQGDVQLARGANGYQIHVTTDPGAAATGVVPQVIDGSEAAAPSPTSRTAAAASGADPIAPAGDTFRRNLGPASFSPQIAGTGTTGRMTRWIDGPNGVVGDTNVSEQSGNVVIGNGGAIGNLQIFGNANNDVFSGMGPDVANGPAFNFGYAGFSFGRSAGFFNVRPDALATGVNPSLRFLTGNVQRMVVTKDGNVGIGQSDPTARLEVVGDSSGQGISASGGTAVFGLTNASDGLGVYGSSTNGEGVRAVAFNGKALNAVSSGSGWSGYFTGKVTINGNLGLGTDTPDALLHLVGGNAHFGGSVGIGTGSPGRELDVVGLFRVQSGAFGVEMKSGGHFVPVIDALENLGETTHRWMTVFATNGTIQTSDARLKQRVHNLGGGLTTLMQLRPVSFEWKDRHDDRRHLGLLAQEVEQVIPEVIYRDANPDAPLGMNYAELVPLVIKAVQEQQVVIEQKNTQINSLEARIAVLENALQQLLKSQTLPAPAQKSGGLR